MPQAHDALHFYLLRLRGGARLLREGGYLPQLRAEYVFSFPFFFIILPFLPAGPPSFLLCSVNYPHKKTPKLTEIPPKPPATACAIVPLFFVAYTTAPFVTFVHVRLPPWARQSKEMLQRFVEGLDNPTKAPSMELELTTMSFLSKPRVSRVAVSELRPASARFGIVNYTRDVAAQNAARPWYHFPAVANFSIQTNRTTRSNNPWLWNVVAEFIAKQRA